VLALIGLALLAIVVLLSPFARKLVLGSDKKKDAIPTAQGAPGE
jgi:hypothetical protein